MTTLIIQKFQILIKKKERFKYRNSKLEERQLREMKDYKLAKDKQFHKKN